MKQGYETAKTRGSTLFFYLEIAQMNINVPPQSYKPNGKITRFHSWLAKDGPFVGQNKEKAQWQSTDSQSTSQFVMGFSLLPVA